MDGTWKVDPQQICDTDEYGSPNNIVLVSGPELMTADLAAEASTSEINDTITTVVRLLIICIFHCQ